MNKQLWAGIIQGESFLCEMEIKSGLYKCKLPISQVFVVFVGALTRALYFYVIIVHQVELIVFFIHFDKWALVEILKPNWALDALEMALYQS
jgi:cytochrome b subunit of formate dehydrogenase